MIKSILAWFAGLFAKETTVTDTAQVPDSSALADVANSSAQSAAVVAATLEAAQASAKADPSDLISNLETILGALGYELPAFWGEAVALAKKVS